MSVVYQVCLQLFWAKGIQQINLTSSNEDEFNVFGLGTNVEISVLILMHEGTCLHLLIYNALTFVKALLHSRTLYNISEYSLGLDLPWGDFWDGSSAH